MDRKGIEQQQKNILQEIRNSSNKTHEVDIQQCLLGQVHSYSNELVKYALGPLGEKLKTLIRYIDLNHPSLFRIFGGSFDPQSEFSKDAIDLLKLASYGIENGISAGVMEHLRQVIKKKHSEIYLRMDKRVGNPLDNLQFLRLLEFSSVRKELRSMKNVQTVHTDLLFKKGKNFYDELPEDLGGYCRNVNHYSDDIKVALEKKQKFDQFGLKAMAEMIQESIEEIKSEWRSKRVLRIQSPVDDRSPQACCLR